MVGRGDINCLKTQGQPQATQKLKLKVRNSFTFIRIMKP